MKKYVPTYEGTLRKHALTVPHCISKCSGIRVFGLEELANGTFLPAIGEIDELDPKGVKRVVMCSGKVYYDLLEQRRKNNQHDVAIVRIEQLYPFPHKAMQEVLQQFAHVKDFVWCQEGRVDSLLYLTKNTHKKDESILKRMFR